MFECYLNSILEFLNFSCLRLKNNVYNIICICIVIPWPKQSYKGYTVFMLFFRVCLSVRLFICPLSFVSLMELYEILQAWTAWRYRQISIFVDNALCLHNEDLLVICMKKYDCKKAIFDRMTAMKTFSIVHLWLFNTYFL